MKTFKNKWNNVAVEDTGCYMSKEAISFCTAFKNMLKREGKAKGFEVVACKSGHYDLYGFVKRGDIYIYVSFDIPRWGSRIDFEKYGTDGVLVRYAQNEKDYKGECNHFCKLSELPEKLSEMFERRERA